MLTIFTLSKGKYMHAFRALLLTLPFLALLALFARPVTELDISTMLTVATFLFAILGGLFITRLNNRYDKARSLIANEDAQWLSFYNMSGFFGKDFEENVRTIINEYYRDVFDNETDNYYPDTTPHVHEAYVLLRGQEKFLNEKQREVFDDMVETLNKLEEARNGTSVLMTERIPLGQWAVLAILGMLIVAGSITLNFPEPYRFLVGVSLSSIVALVLFMMRDLQNLKLGGQSVGTESGQEILEATGNLRYYNLEFLVQGTAKIPEKVKKFRLGLHTSGEKPDVVTVDLTDKSDYEKYEQYIVEGK